MSTRGHLRLVEDKTKAAVFIPKPIEGDFWSEDAGKVHSLHHVYHYYKALNPELVNFCIRKYSKKGDVVCDPFVGSGTTALQANLLGRISWSSDINPLSVLITTAKTYPVGLDEVVLRLNDVNFNAPVGLDDFNSALYAFYDPQTYRELCNLRKFLNQKRDRVNCFIELLAVSRLHGHTQGHFSVYSSPYISLPPMKQLQLNLRRRQQPEYRTIASRVIKRAAQVLQDGFSAEFFDLSFQNKFCVSDAQNLRWLPSNCVDMVITAPPLLDNYNYYNQHWLDFWFTQQEVSDVQNSSFLSLKPEAWANMIRSSLQEMLRALKPDKYAVLIIGEAQIADKKILFDEIIANELKNLNVNGKFFRIQEVLIPRQHSAERVNTSDNKGISSYNRIMVLQSKSRS